MNVRVLWGRGDPGREAPAFWPWVQVVRSYVRSIDRGNLEEELGLGASLIAEIIPDLRELTPSAKAPPPTRDPNTDSTARYWFFDALTQFIKKASNVRPWLLLLDDLHWWDEPSLKLFSYLVREMTDSPVMIIAAYRDSELYKGIEFKQVIADLTRDQLFE